MNASYPHVFEPLTIGPVALRNRIFFPAHTTYYGEDNLPSARHLAYHRERARGGVALIIFESIRVHEATLGSMYGIAGYDPACIAPFRRIVEAVHEEGAKLFGQIIHTGRHADGDWPREAAWGASARRWSPTSPLQHVMDRDDMQTVIDGHVRAAENLIAAGLDGFEVHFGHGHLLQEFLSPVSNDRTDAFGGSEENRLRFPLEVFKAVREAVGPERCLGIRISAEEFIEGGLTLDMMERYTRALADAVQVDFVNVSHSAYIASYSLATQMADMAFDATPFRALPDGIRRTLRDAGHDVPVFAVCKFRGLDEAEDMLKSGRADMVGMVRAHIADPHLVRRARDGSRQRPCIGCNQGCAGFLDRRLPITCVVNPATGREGTWSVEPADDPARSARRVLVVGAGPAGLEAAWVAAARGHSVAVWEQADAAGGRLRYLRKMPLRTDFLGLIEYQAGRCADFGVRIETGRTADADAVARFAPDLVVLATGARTPAPTLERGNALTLEEAIDAPDRLGQRVALYDTIGEWSALAAVEHIADLGKEVTVFTPAEAFAWRTTIYSGLANRKRLRDKGVRRVLAHRVLGLTNEGLAVEDLSSGATETYPGFDSLVVAQYGDAEDSLYAPLRERGIAVERIGDCHAPRTALEAVFEGHRLARRL